MRNLLLSCQLLHLIQENVHLELGAQVLETAVAERLPVARMEKKKKKPESVSVRSDLRAAVDRGR